MTADQVLRHLAELNAALGAGVLLVLVARRIVRTQLGAQVAYRLWLIVPLVALGTLVPPRTTLGQASSRFVPEAGLAARQIPELPGGADQILPLAPTLLWLWTAGVAVSAAWALYQSRRVASDPALGPALVGVIRPRLVLPADFHTRFTAEERRLILEHEAVHASARHPAINAAIEMIRWINWFNPLVHLGAFYARVDQELACDAVVVGRFPADRSVYARTLLKSQLSSAFLPLGCQWPGRTKPLLMERIEMLGHARISRSLRLTGTAAIALVAAGGGVCAWAAQPPRAEQASASSPRSIGAAIAAGDGLAVRELGGAPEDVLAALSIANRLNQPGGGAYAARMETELKRFADTSDGANLAYIPFTGPDVRHVVTGRSVGGAHWGLERRTPDGTVQYILLMRDCGADLRGSSVKDRPGEVRP